MCRFRLSPRAYMVGTGGLEPPRVSVSKTAQSAKFPLSPRSHMVLVRGCGLEPLPLRVTLYRRSAGTPSFTHGWQSALELNQTPHGAIRLAIGPSHQTGLRSMFVWRRVEESNP